MAVEEKRSNEKKWSRVSALYFPSPFLCTLLSPLPMTFFCFSLSILLYFGSHSYLSSLLSLPPPLYASFPFTIFPLLIPFMPICFPFFPFPIRHSRPFLFIPTFSIPPFLPSLTHLILPPFLLLFLPSCFIFPPLASPFLLLLLHLPLPLHPILSNISSLFPPLNSPPLSSTPSLSLSPPSLSHLLPPPPRSLLSPLVTSSPLSSSLPFFSYLTPPSSSSSALLPRPIHPAHLSRFTCRPDAG